MSASSVPVSAVHVVVPAHDEEELLPACLAALGVAVGRVRRERPGLEVTVTVVLDACTDASARVVADLGWPEVVVIDRRAVGAARAAGVDHGRSLSGAHDPRGVWVASTDADSEVPPGWLTHQLDLCDLGIEMVVGTVRPQGLAPRVLARWSELHRMVDGHPHVHGANLGLTLSAYDLAGGFAPLRLHEDVLLVAAVRGAGTMWVASAAAPVLTSGREANRAGRHAGFAGYIRGLVEPA